MYYSETHSYPINRTLIMSMFGVDPLNDPASAYKLNIFPVVEQAAGYGVSHYVKEGGSYRAIAYPYTIEEQQTMNMIRTAKVKAEEVKAWVATQASPETADEDPPKKGGRKKKS